MDDLVLDVQHGLLRPVREAVAGGRGVQRATGRGDRNTRGIRPATDGQRAAGQLQPGRRQARADSTYVRRSSSVCCM